MTKPNHSGDELLLRYREASAQDLRRPGVHVRSAVRAQAQAETLARSKKAGARPDSALTKTPAANASRWKLSLLASVALAGLTGLLVLQFDRAEPDEKNIATGPAQPQRPAAPAPAQTPEQQATAPPMASPSSSPPSLAARPDRSAAPPGSAGPKTSSEPPARALREAGPAASSRESPLPAKPTAPPPAVVAPASPAELSTADSALDTLTAEAKMPRAEPSAPRARQQAAPSPGTAPALSQNKSAGDAPERQRNPAVSGLAQGDPTTALFLAARAGRVPDLDRALAQGAPLNALDAAGRTALTLAVINGHAGVVQRLLALGANPALIDQSGLNALDHARRGGNEAIVRLLAAAS